MTEGPLGGAAFNNEFGRPNLGGYFRVYEQARRPERPPRLPQADHDRRRPRHIAAHGQTAQEALLPAGTLLIQLGGPGMRIGMGGGAASSMAAGTNTAALDFDSGAARQPGDPAPRAGGHQPLLGAGREQPDPGDPRRRRRRHQQRLPGTGRRRRPRRALRPAQGAARGDRAGAEGDLVQREPGALRRWRWTPDLLPLFEQMCERERCPFAVVGVATDERMAAGPGRRPRGSSAVPSTCRWTCCSASRRRCMRDVKRIARARRHVWSWTGVELEEVAFDVLRHPTVASKRFLVTIGDRTVGGHEPPRPDGRPVAGAGGRLRGDAGRLPPACAARRWPWASARRWRRSNAPGLGPHGGGRGRHQPAGGADRAQNRASSCRCNWMAACGEPGEDAALYDTVRAVGLELCPALGIGVPVGKDSLSMKTRWSDGGATCASRSRRRCR